jgi:hypothetical protein
MQDKIRKLETTEVIYTLYMRISWYYICELNPYKIYTLIYLPFNPNTFLPDGEYFFASSSYSTTPNYLQCIKLKLSTTFFK